MPHVRIGLLWHAYGRPNLGVDALCRAHIAILRLAAAQANLTPQFFLLGKPAGASLEDDDIVQGPHLRVRHLLTGRLGPYLNEMRNCDLIFDISAGDGFTTIYGSFLFYLHCATKWAALYSGRPLILAPQTIGPFTGKLARIAAASILKRAHSIFVRDHISARIAAEFVPGERIEEVTDVALQLPYKQAARIPGLTRVGINVSGLLNCNPRNFNLTINHQELIDRFIQYLQKFQDTEVWLISHVIHEDASKEDDAHAAESVASRHPGVELAPQFTTSIEAKNFISGMDFFTGGRMHACIAAFSSGVPVVPIAYSHKFQGLFQRLEYPPIINAMNMTTMEALSLLIESYEMRDILRARLVDSQVISLRLLETYDKHLTALFGKLPKLLPTGNQNLL